MKTQKPRKFNCPPYGIAYCHGARKGGRKMGTDGMAIIGDEGSHQSLATAVVFATPQARDYRTGSTDRWENPKRSRNLNDQIGGQLNPNWVAWLMGWPIEWINCGASATDKFRQWCASHGIYSQEGAE